MNDFLFVDCKIHDYTDSKVIDAVRNNIDAYGQPGGSVCVHVFVGTSLEVLPV